MQETLTSSALGAIRWNYGRIPQPKRSRLCRGDCSRRVLLGPKPFGQLGVAAIVFGLGNLLADAGFSSALVQSPQLAERQIRFAFTMQVAFGCA